MKKIIIYTDILRPGNWIKENIQIIEHLFSYQLKVLGFEMVSLLDEGFQLEEFFLYNNNIASKNDFHALSKNQKEQLWINANTKPITQEAIDYFTSFFTNHMALAYHSSNAINSMLETKNITYLDIFETSYRYLSDTYLAFRTNNSTMATILLNNYAISEHNLYIQANYLKALFIRNKTFSKKIDPNSCLIVCQTPLDIALIKNNGEIDQLLNYTKEIIQLSTQHKTLYYKLHPKSPTWHNNKLKAFFKTIKNAKQINYDMYECLCNNNFTTICGINSSALYEAKYFSKKIIFLGKLIFSYSFYGQSYEKESYIMLKDNALLFNINFWSHLLNNQTTTISQYDIYSNSNDLIRNCLNISSSYQLSHFLEIKKLKKSFTMNKIKRMINKWFKIHT